MEETINLSPENDEQSVSLSREMISIGGGVVNSVNGQTGDVVLTTSDLENNSGYQTSSEVESAISSAIAGKQDTLTAGTNISIADNTISATDTTYTAGTNISITDNTISATDTTYTAGANITIDSDNKISATDTTYSNFTGTDGQTAGTAGLVPAPETTDTDKFLKSDGTWDTAGGGSSVNVVQTTGTSTTDVMSQNATTSMVFDDPATKYQVKIGAGTSVGADRNVAIGRNATAASYRSLAVGSYAWTDARYTTAVGAGALGVKEGGTALGYLASTGNTALYGTALGADSNVDGTYNYSVALGARSRVTRSGEVNVGTGNGSYGFNSTKYRVIGGVHDGQLANDAATVGQINATIDAINTALNTNIPHVGAST
ncbi:hypothetical protein IKG38_03655 [Candidatus Saccharibacteria bacterium]|nr:hypothetical protein [Candidatus Saccharibacteria bacterium]